MMPDRQIRRGTRERLLDAACEMFAERGFEGVTAKQICERADVNPAAVNYHFDGLEGLYEAVLLEAHAQAQPPEDSFREFMDAPVAIAEKLRMIIVSIVRVLQAPGPSAWILRLFSQELANPTEIGRRVVTAAAAPRLQRVRVIVGAFLELPPD
jgi:AcrR family transcriptional regulator